MQFLDLVWRSSEPGFCERADVEFDNGFGVSFLRGEGRNASIYMNSSKSYYKGPFEISPWFPNGEVMVDGMEGEWPKHGDAAEMQRLMDVIESLA